MSDECEMCIDTCGLTKGPCQCVCHRTPQDTPAGSTLHERVNRYLDWEKRVQRESTDADLIRDLDAALTIAEREMVRLFDEADAARRALTEAERQRNEAQKELKRIEDTAGPIEWLLTDKMHPAEREALKDPLVRVRYHHSNAVVQPMLKALGRAELVNLGLRSERDQLRKVLNDALHALRPYPEEGRAGCLMGGGDYHNDGCSTCDFVDESLPLIGGAIQTREHPPEPPVVPEVCKECEDAKERGGLMPSHRRMHGPVSEREPRREG